MNDRRLDRPLRAAVLVCALAAGCGGGSDDSPTTTADTADTDALDVGSDAAEDAARDTSAADDAGAADADADGAVSDAEPSDAASDATTDVIEGPAEVLPRLAGDSAGGALGQLPDHGPVFVADDMVLDDGLMLNRLIAGVDETATLLALNEALSTFDAGISMARSDRPWVELAIPPQADLEGLEELSDRLMADPAFDWVEPAYALFPDPTPDGPTDKALVPVDTLSVNPYLAAQGFVGSWMLEHAAARSAVPTMIVFDGFIDVVGHPAISALQFAPTESATLRGGPDEFQGNHGFWVSGIIAADPDEVAPTGTSPAPTRVMSLRGVQGVNLSGVASVEHLRSQIPGTGNVVVNMSLGFATLDAVDPFAALAWRRMMDDVGDRMIVTCTTGNRGLTRPVPDGRRNSECTLQASFDDLSRIAPASRRDSFRRLWQSETAQNPRLSAALGSTLLVGSSGATGARSPFSTPGEDVRMIGEQIVGPCVRDDSICVGGFYLSNGTSAAAPQAAGLAAYLWALEPSLTPAQLRELMVAHYDGRWIDAFAAVMHLPAFAPAFPALATLVDVNDDGRFDAADIRLVLREIDAQEAAFPDAATAPRDHARFDLNGDGFTRSDAAARFAMEPTNPPFYSTHAYRFSPGNVDVELDENAMTDLDVLCAAAYSDLLAVDARDLRDALLTSRCAPPIDPGVRWEAEDVVSYRLLVERSTSDGTFAETLEVLARVTETEDDWTLTLVLGQATSDVRNTEHPLNGCPDYGDSRVLTADVGVTGRYTNMPGSPSVGEPITIAHGADVLLQYPMQGESVVETPTLVGCEVRRTVTPIDGENNFGWHITWDRVGHALRFQSFDSVVLPLTLLGG